MVLYTDATGDDCAWGLRFVPTAVFPLQPPLACVHQLKAFVGSENEIALDIVTKWLALFP
jgi:hypothetical protein